MMRHLWQRIFAYSLVLVIVSQLAVLILHRYSVNRDEAQRFIMEYAGSLASSVTDESRATAGAILRVFNRKRDRAWLEDGSGAVLAGARPRNVRPGKVVREVPDRGLVIMEAGPDEMYIAAAPVTLREGGAKLFMVFGPPRPPAMWTMFFQGLIFVSVIGLLLAFWMARRVSAPLRAMRDEVMGIAAGDLDGRVTVKGYDEIKDVARAVNHMADGLARHIRGMRELVANISHEMRSPLARIQVSMAMLEEDVAGNAKAAGRIALINEELDSMNALIGATLLSSKLDLQPAAVPEDAVAFSDLCAEACRRHAPVFARRGLRFRPKIRENVVVTGEETLLSTLVSNLLDNAAKYTAEGGAVGLRLGADADGVLLEVENEHEPLPQDVLDHLFEPFYRGGVATGNGAGLGLSLVKRIALRLGGDAVAANTGTGLRFSVRFPAPAGAGA